jgi:hypothetical protein
MAGRQRGVTSFGEQRLLAQRRLEAPPRGCAVDQASAILEAVVGRPKVRCMSILARCPEFE